MKQQIVRLSPHQNGKVVAALMAVTSLVFFLPFYLVFWVASPSVDAHGNPLGPPLFFFLLAPLFYLVVGYLMAVIGCVIDNVLFRYIGGIEFTARQDGA